MCTPCHKYWRGDKQIASVSSVLRGVWPIRPDYSKAKPEVIENARDRGVAVDELFSAYVNGTLDRIPAGTRKDAVRLFHKVRGWWDSHKRKEARSQVILADNEIAGTCDILADDWIWDLKSTYNVEPTYPLQVAAYGELHFATFGRPVKGLGIIHVTERFPEPKIIKIPMDEALQDWMAVRTMWSLVRRRHKKEFEREAELVEV
jgi:hypothetical protein